MAFEKLIKESLSKCPFCGAEADLQANNKRKVFSKLSEFHDYTCCVCNAVIKARIIPCNYEGKQIESFLVVETGTVNKHNLCSGNIYNPSFLQQLCLKFNEDSADFNKDAEYLLSLTPAERAVLKQQERINLHMEKMKNPAFRWKTRIKNIFALILFVGVIVGTLVFFKFFKKFFGF